MKLTVIGCSGTFPGPTSPCSSYLVEAEGFKLLIDVGNGSTGALQQCGDLLDIDAVFVSHLHGDHYLDLITYTYARRYHPSGCPPPLPVYGPADVHYQLASAFARPVGDLLSTVYEFHTLQPGRMEVGPFTVDLARVNHPVETYGMRIAADGASLTYSADTGETDALVDLAKGTDLFLCEASYLDGDDNPPHIHLTGRQAAEHAARADVQKLVLTHLVPWGDPGRTVAAAADVYDGELGLAQTCGVFDI